VAAAAWAAESAVGNTSSSPRCHAFAIHCSGSQRAAQGLPPRSVFPHRHGPDGAKRVMEGAAAGLAVMHHHQQQQQQEVLG
jgi:hypothetical protein